MHLSIGETGDAGGVAFVVKRKLLGEATTIRMQTLVEGRAAVLQVTAGTALLEVAGVHIFGLTISQANTAASDLQHRTRAAQDAPMQRCLWVAGDWNFDAPGESPLVVGESAARQAGPQRPRLGPASLRRSLSCLTDVHQPRNTQVAPGPTSVHCGSGMAPHTDGLGGPDHE